MTPTLCGHITVMHCPYSLIGCEGVIDDMTPTLCGHMVYCTTQSFICCEGVKDDMTPILCGHITLMHCLYSTVHLTMCLMHEKCVAVGP